MSRFIPLVVGALLAAFGIAALATAGARSRESGRERDQKVAAEREIADLKDRLRQLEARPQEPPAPPKVEPVDDAAETATLKREVETLRSALQASLAKLAELKAQNLRPERDRPKPEDSAALQARALDQNETSAERMAAFSKLRSIPGGRTEAIGIAMLDLAESGIEARARARILSDLKDAIPVAQAQRVIAFLKSDPERDVREEAAESLGPLKHLDVVRSALDEAARSDAAESVRSQAKRALERN